MRHPVGLPPSSFQKALGCLFSGPLSKGAVFLEQRHKPVNKAVAPQVCRLVATRCCDTQETRTGERVMQEPLQHPGESTNFEEEFNSDDDDDDAWERWQLATHEANTVILLPQHYAICQHDESEDSPAFSLIMPMYVHHTCLGYPQDEEECEDDFDSPCLRCVSNEVSSSCAPLGSCHHHRTCAFVYASTALCTPRSGGLQHQFRAGGVLVPGDACSCSVGGCTGGQPTS